MAVQFAEDGVPLIQECNRLACETRTLVIWGITAVMLVLVGMCVSWNYFIHWRAGRATEVPKFLRNIRKQQARPVHPLCDGFAPLQTHAAACYDSV